MKKYLKVVFILIILVLVAVVFYWYDLRPRAQRESCWRNALNLSETALNLQYDTCMDSADCRERAQFQYETCLHLNYGLSN